jgi:DNA anti-recombination protein RmuC
MMPGHTPPTSLDKPPHGGNDAAMSARIARQEATVEEVLRRLDYLQQQITEFRQESSTRFETSRKESERRWETMRNEFEAMRKQGEARIEAMRKEGEARIEAMRKEGEARIAAMRTEGDARIDAIRKEGEARVEVVRKGSDEKFQFLVGELRTTHHLIIRVLTGLAVALVALVGTLGIALLH